MNFCTRLSSFRIPLTNGRNYSTSRTTRAVKNKRKVVVGLALGSGSAKGWSHIGVIRALEKHHIYPQVIAGTSMGSLVGGAYAAGKLDELEEFARAITWRDYIALSDIALLKRNLSGIINGDKIVEQLLKLAAAKDLDIEKLPKKFGAVATDLKTGREVWFTSGSFVTAIRSSAAMPGVFAPVSYKAPGSEHQQWLADGGLVNPVPVSLCRALGADVVIAVNLNKTVSDRREPSHDLEKNTFESNFFGSLLLSPLPKSIQETASSVGSYLTKTVETISKAKPLSSSTAAIKIEKIEEELETNPAPHLLKVIQSAINIMQYRITISRMAGDPPEVELAPKLHLDSFDFDRAAIGIEDGIAAVEMMLPAIKDAIKNFE